MRLRRWLEAELLNLSMDACEGMANDAIRLVTALGKDGEIKCWYVEQRPRRADAAELESDGGAARRCIDHAERIGAIGRCTSRCTKTETDTDAC